MGSQNYELLSSLEVCLVLKSGDGRTYAPTDDMCKNNDHYRPGLWVGLVDQFLQKKFINMCKRNDGLFLFISIALRFSRQEKFTLISIGS